MIATTTVPRDVIPLHEVTDAAKLDRLVVAMQSAGWQGRPVLCTPEGDGWRALTGSHRIVAAIRAGLAEIPLCAIEDGDLTADQWEEAESGLLAPHNEDDDRLARLRDLVDEGADLSGAVALMAVELEKNTMAAA